MLGFVRTDSEALVSCLGDSQRAVTAYHELLRRDEDAVGAIRAGLRHENPAVREGCCRLLDHLVDTDSMAQLISMADDPDARSGPPRSTLWLAIGAKATPAHRAQVRSSNPRCSTWPPTRTRTRGRWPPS